MAQSYYAKKKEESDKKIAEALEARKNRVSTTSKATTSSKSSADDSYAAKKEAYDKRLQDALDARSERIQSTLPEILSDIQDRYNREVNSYNSTKKPSFGSFESTYDSQRESRINLSKLRDKVEAYRGYMADGVADQLLSSLEQMRSGYDSHLTYSRFKNQEEYDTAKQQYDWQQKYQGKSYSDLQRTLSGMKEGDEKKWLLDFATSVMNKDDYDKVIASESRELEPLKKLMEEAGKIQREAWSGNPADANRQNKNARLQALAKRYGYSSYEEAKTRYDELQKSQYEHTNASKYKFLDENQDYEVLSKQVAEDPTAGFGIGIGDKWWGKGDPKYDYINDIDGTRQSYYGRFASGGGSPYAIYDQMTDEEIASYNYLYNAEGEQAANDYLEYLEYTLNERMQGTAAANAKMLADEYPVFASAVSVPINLMSGIGAIGVAGQNIARGISGEYKPIDYNASTMAPGVISSTIRGTVSQNITNATGQIELDEEEHPVLSRILNGKSLGDVYQLGMSMADSAAIAAMAPAIGSAGTALLGGSAASQGILDAVAAGANDEQAIMMGVMNGAFEMLFEKVSLDNLLNGKSRNILTAMFKQGVIEGTEEFNTTLANTLADILVMAEKSSYKSSIAEYEAQGLSTEDATKRALLDVAIQMGWDFVGGMASGGLMGGASAPIQNYQYANEEGNRIYGEDADALIGEALEINPESKLANKLNDRLTDGKKVSGAQLYKLAEENEATMYSQDMTAIQKTAETRLSALGETGDVEAISAALAKQAAGKKLTKSERATLAGSRYAQRVANELNPANIESGGYASGWTAEIGTNRINADEYNRIVDAANLPQDGGNVAEDKLDAKPQNVATTQNPQAGEGVMDVSPVTASEDVTPVAVAEPVTQEEPQEEAEAEEENPITLEDASQKYGAQAGAMVHTYVEGQDVAKYDAAYQAAYDMGMSGVSLSYAKESESTSYLSETQRELAYEAGVAAADTSAKAQAAKNQAKINGKTGRRTGTVQGKGVSIADLKQTFNDPQGKAYRYLTTVAEATGIDIVLYKSEANEDGVFEGAQGKFTWSEDKIYIDVNAGLVKAKDVNELSKYAMLRTFAHEFTHFIEKWNPVQYNELRKVVFDTLTERGENVHDLIERKRAQASNMTYDMASREVVAEAMTDILPDANFVQELAEKHKNLFQKLLEKLKEFVDNLRDYFNTLAKNPSREANALKEEVGESVKYLESIVRLFDNVAVEAVEAYQKTVAVEEVKAEATEVTEETEVTEVTEAIPEPVSVTDEHGFTVTDNVERGSLEISFDSKPSDKVRDVLKEKKFRWNKTKKVWYGYADRADITDALRAAYEAENQATGQAEEAAPAPVAEAAPEVHPIAEEKPQEPTPEGVGEYADVYDRLRNPLSRLPRYWTSGFLFRVYKVNGKWEGHVDAAEQHDGYEIANARGVHYTSELYDNRNDAVEDIIAVARNNRLLDPVGVDTTQKTEEVKNNGNEEETGTVLPHRGDGQGTARLLGEVEAEDVQGDGAERNHVADAGERGDQAGRHDLGADAGTRHERGHGEGSSQSGDLRRDDGVTSEEPAPETAEQLHEEVVEQVKQQSTEQPKGNNFVIGDSLNLPNGEKARYKANVDAIRLVKQLEQENRYATPEEQEILSKYVGWGGLANAFDPRKADWKNEYAELKELLTDEEYSLARGSTLNAHYTDISVIKAMYDGLAGLGFDGGRLMEPSAGVGNFVGAMPPAMSAKVKSWTMVELDSITGKIAKYLYPNADVRIQGFEKANIPNNFMDVAISNVPFGNYAIADKSYPKKVTSAIHNYFFAKAIDKVRPGGIVMFITSSYTMNSRDNTVRKYIMQRADLLGAIRLPDTAFKGNAGTEVVTDILILKKRAANTEYAGEDFLEAPWTRPVPNNYNGAYINTYFENHPEMVLGTPSMEGSMYRGESLTYKAFTDRGSLADQIREAFTHITGMMDYPAQKSPEKTNFSVEREGKKTKKNGLVVKDGKVYQNTEDGMTEVKVAKGVAERISGMLEIRDAAKELMNAQQQGLKDSEIKKARAKLNKLYDAFVQKHGFINSQVNRNAMKDDPDKYSIFALENYNPETKKGTKADIFSKNTIAPNRTVTSAKDVTEGLIVSVNQTGGVDTALIAKLTGMTEEAVTRELLDSRQAFKNRDGALEPAEVYLSGNVRAKLRDAEALAPIDADYQKNVEALRAVVPADVPYQDIFVNPGTPWIPNSVYSDFAAYMLGGRNTEWRTAVEVTRNPETGNFTVELKERYLKTNAANTQKWGTARRSFLELFDAMLNSRSVVIKNKLDDGTTVVDKDATAAANEKIENIQKEFQEWLWKDEARRNDLVYLYNETFNAIVTPKYNGDNLTVNGANAMKPLRPHQRNAVQRVISSGGNTLLAHKVGAGKTYEMAAAAMKLKELGLVRKPMFAVPKSLVAQWGTEFMDFFPTAKLLVAEASDFTAANRKVFMNRIANGEYDAVIVSYEQFERLPISNDFARELYQEQIDSIILAIEEAKAEKGGKSLSVKDLEKKRKSLQTKIDKLTDSAKDEDNISFEQLGVDSLFIDEAHNFKNLFYTTSMTNVAGLGNKDGSKRAFDLYTKVRYLQKLNGGRGIVFATATPVMNSMSEMYIMQKYLQPDLLEQLGLNTFDAWAKQFGEVVNGVEIKPSGQGYRVKQSFSRFKNMSELQLLFRNFADVLTDIPGLKIPKMKGGKVNVVVCEPGSFQQDYMKELEKRADNVKNVDPSVDNMLKITSDGRKISYTQRMIDPSLPYEEGCKIYRCAENVARVYEEDKANKGTQLIFCDMATPKGKSNTAATEAEETETDMESAKLYDDIKARLIENGIPAKEIAFIHDADTDAKKKKLFADVNDGKVRVLIGSTGKMGVGMNAQKRVAAIHHLDAPWRPGDVEQRNGRAFRQGNIHDEVECFTYVTEGSFDARLWDILERKQNFINQVMNGENVGRETEDTGEVTLSAAEVKALASGSPLIMEQVQLDTDIKKLESLYRAHNSAVASAKLRLESDKGTIANLEKRIANGKIDLKNRVDTYSDGKFSMTIGKQKYTDPKEAGKALMAAAAGNATEEGYTTIGKFAGFELQVVKTYEGIKGRVAGAQGYSFNTYPGNTTHMITRLISVVEGIDETMEQWEKNLVATRSDMAEQEKLIAAPFAKQAELDQKRARYNEVMAILNPKEEQALGTMDEDTVQEQSRGYLEEREPAPVFYSQMAKVVDGVKIGKLEASSVVNMLRGKGVKAEEIKWSGIETWLEGKKSVTKAELQEFIAGSMLKIEEQMSGTATFIADDGNTYKSEADFKDAAYAIADARGIDRIRVKFVIDTEYDMDAYAYVGAWNNTILTAEVSNVEGTSPRFSQYKLDGGTNYREILFTMPDNSYSNRAMRTHWGDDAEGVLAHARIQDFAADGGKMLFVEEIQSDYHNEGHQSGYADSKLDAEIARLQAEADKRFFALEDYSTEVTGLAGEWETVEKTVKGSRLLLEYLDAKDAYDKAMNDYVKRVPDAPFRDSYHEYVLKRLIRMAAEQGYDSIGWTTAKMQSDRWSEEYAEGYRIEYDQDIPKFLNKYGKKWGAKVGKTRIGGNKLTFEEEVDLALVDDLYTDAERDKIRGVYEVWTMPITDTMKESVLYEGQTQYQERTNTLTDREVLAMAAEQVKVDTLTDAERDALAIFQKRLEKLTDLEEQRAEQGRLYKEQQFGAKPDRAAAAETLDRMHVLDAQIKRASADVLSVEEKTVLRNVLKKARKVVENQQWAHDQEILRRWRDRRANAEAVKKYRDRVRRDVDELTKWVLHPSNKDVVKHIPDALKESVIPFLSSINFMSKQSLKGGNATVADKAFQKQLKSLKAALRQNIDTYGLYSGYNDLPPNFMDRLQNFIDSVDAIVEKNSGEFVINQMTSDELRELSKVVRTLKDYIQQFNRFHVNAMYHHVYEAGDDTIRTLGLMKNASDKTGTLSNFVLWQQMRPAYAFERFGNGGKAIYDGLREGQAKLAFNTKTIVDFSKKAYTAKEVNAWEQEIKSINLGGDIVKMRVSQIMSLYELSKRKQALGHILKGGIRVATFKNGKHKISDVGHVITQEDLQTIISTLTPRQMEVADKLQKFMAEQGGTWGNYVSVKRFGEEMFGEKEYFPINSDGRHLQSNADEAPGAASLYALLNMSFTKELTENASNRIILYSIFDVFSNHMASMAQYNAFALPVLDALKWFNYQMKSDPDENGKRFVLGSVRDQMARVYGTPEETRPGSGKKGYAEIFVENILKAFNGTEAQGTSYDSIGMRSLHAYNRAQVAYNFRVVVQQPLAITRAAQIIDFRSIVQGTKLSPVAVKKNIEEMRKYSGIAAWKALGFYDVNISRGLNAIIKHSDTATDKLIEVGMKGAETADTLTWAGIWSACKAEVMRKQKLKPKDAGFYEAVTKLFEDVIYKTQVVDSVLTKNEFMRDKGFFARLIGSFMSEPTATASMLVDAVDKYNRAIQGGMTKQRAWQRNGKQIARTIYVYSVGAVMLAAVQAAADALRDDDDYQTFMEKWLEAFGGNAVDELMPLNKLPIISDFYEAAKEIVATWTGWDIYGNPPQSVFMQWYDSLVKGGEILHDRIMGEDTNYTWYGGIYKLLQALSGMTGLPMAAATREAITAWNNTVGAMAPSLKVKTYEPSEKAQIKYAYEDGYLTAEEATQELLEKALVDTEDEAYWTIQGWEAGEGYSRYDAIMDAVRNGTGFDDAMDELTSHGYTEREVLSQVKSGIGEMYRDGQITKQQATRMLEKHLDMTDDEITEVVNKWSCQVVTGIPYDDIKQEFLDGNITATRAIDMRVRYGGYTREEATETVTEWRAEKETGIAYDEIDEAFHAGEISQADARDMYVTYGGKTAEEAEEKVAVLAFVKEHPECKGISYAAVEDYTTYCEADGVPAGTFYDAWKYNSNTHADVDANGESISGSKKVKVLAYIDTLALTSAQKDSLYYAFGWAQSRIYEAPWH